MVIYDESNTVALDLYEIVAVDIEFTYQLKLIRDRLGITLLAKH